MRKRRRADVEREHVGIAVPFGRSCRIRRIEPRARCHDGDPPRDTILTPVQVNARSNDFVTFTVPAGKDGAVKKSGLSQAYLGKTRYVYSKFDDTITDTTTNQATPSMRSGPRRTARARRSRRDGRSPERFTALFVGKLIPLHGLETILEAARLVPELHFSIVGSGQLDALLDDAARRTSSGFPGSIRAAAGRAPRARLRARDLRHLRRRPPA